MRRFTLVLVLVAVALSVLMPGMAQALYSCDMAELFAAMGQKGSPGYYWYSALCVIQTFMLARGDWEDL